MAQITIADATPKVQYTIGSGGSTGPFSIPWPFFATSDIKVYWDSTLKTETTHYTVNGTAVDDGFSGGSITLGSSQASITVTIVRDIPIARTTDFPVGPFNIATLNKDLDKLYAIGQQLDSGTNDTFRFADTETSTASTIIPSPVASTVLSWNSSANALESTITASAISGAQTQATNAASSATAAASSASTASTQATLAGNYATKVDGVVTGSDHSSKAWSVGGTGVTDTAGKGAAKEWATEAEDNTVDGTSYSAKHHAIKAAASASAASSSASAAAAGQIYSTIVNQTGSTLSPALSADGTYYLCDTSSNSVTVTLPAIGTTEGCKFAFQKTHASNSLIFQRSGSDTLNGSSSNITLTDVDAQIIFVSDNNSPDNWVGTNLNQIQAGTGLTKTGSVMAVTAGGIGLTQIATAAKTECIAIACSDETTALEAGTAKATFHMPYAFTLTGVKAGVTTAPAGSVLTVDINEAGATILTTKLTIDAGEKTSATAATAAVIGGAGPALAADALMTVDIDGVGSGTAGAGLKVYLIGYQT